MMTEIDPTAHKSTDSGSENFGYIRNSSDHHLATLLEEDNSSVTILPRNSSSKNSFPVIYEASMEGRDPIRSESSFTHHPSSSSITLMQNQTRRRSSAQGPQDRQLSILDPTTDRVSTILVWKNLSVQARESKWREMMQYMKSYKKFVPKRKYLLHDTTGAITGGLWAVMGKAC